MLRVSFEGLPPGKIKGFCEPPEGNLYSSIVVDIDKDCRDCRIGRCHMFLATTNEAGETLRTFQTHPPEYRSR